MSEVELILTKLKIVSEEQEKGMYLCDKEHSKMLLDYITNLQEENKSFKKHWVNLIGENLLMNEIQNLQQRIDKAIEYINSNEMLKLREDFEYCNDKDLFDDFAGRLDRILRGSDKE